MSPDGDLQRIRNQQEFLNGLTSSRIAGLAVQLRSLRSGDIDFFSAPISGAGTSKDGQAILLVDEDAQKEIQDAFQNDTVAEYAANAEDIHL